MKYTMITLSLAILLSSRSLITMKPEPYHMPKNIASINDHGQSVKDVIVDFEEQNESLLKLTESEQSNYHAMFDTSFLEDQEIEAEDEDLDSNICIKLGRNLPAFSNDVADKLIILTMMGMVGAPGHLMILRIFTPTILEALFTGFVKIFRKCNKYGKAS